MPSGGFAFGRFRLDLPSKQLFCDDTLVVLPPRYVDVLILLVSRAGESVSRDRLMDAVWKNVVNENTVEQAMSRLRRVLAQGGGTERIETMRSMGYRFIGSAARIEARLTEADVAALLTPFEALTDGRALIETLAQDDIARARALFAARVEQYPGDATFHVGLANACIFLHEATRADARPDHGARDLALRHAHDACRLNPTYAEAWATLGFVLGRTGERVRGVAALRRAVSLDPVNWQHRIRLAFIGWGAERLTAAYEALSLLPGCAMAHGLAATVFIARGLLDRAEHEVDLGLAAVEAGSTTRFAVGGLYWLKGLLRLADGATDDALMWFGRELALESRGHFYARECCAHAWYAIGASDLLRGDRVAAQAGFEQAIARVPTHAMAHAGLRLLEGPGSVEDASLPSSLQDALARAVALVANGRARQAAALVAAMIALAPPGDAGWLLPVDPLLGLARDPDAWTRVRALLQDRAS